MKSTLLTYLLLFCFPVTALAQHNQVLTDNIKTLRCHVLERPDAFPSIELNGGEHISVEFDYLSHEYRRFLYRLEHCDADWGASEDLFDTDFLTGYNGEEPIEDYAKSLNTNLLYTHYQLRLPNEKIGFRLAGNYRLSIIDDSGDEPTVVAQACFVVVRPSVTITAQASTDTEVDRNDTHQQLTVGVNFNGLPVRDARRELSIVVLQNRRYDNAVRRPAPTSVTARSLLWEHARQLIFPAGNEYRKFELIDTRMGSIGVDQIRWFDPYYHATLFTDTPRRNYLYDEDQNGRSVIRTATGGDSATEADYVFVHFSLQTPQRTDGDFYLNGDWTDDQFSDEWRLTYDDAGGCYRAAPLLKLGYYSYQYLFVPHDQPGVGQTAPAEGNFYQTENEYTLLVYHRAQGARYEEPVGVLSFRYRP